VLSGALDVLAASEAALAPDSFVVEEESTQGLRVA